MRGNLIRGWRCVRLLTLGNPALGIPEDLVRSVYRKDLNRLVEMKGKCLSRIQKLMNMRG